MTREPGTGERLRVEEALRRIDDLVEVLGHGANPTAHETARSLVEALLDLHGLALARVMAIAASQGGCSLLDALAADEQIKAVLLLYGLHPDDPPTRIERALDALRPRLTAAGLSASVTPAGGKTVAVRVTGVGPATALRDEIEMAILDAAPDLDQITVEWPEPLERAEMPALAG